ncbi:hypothetical protein LJB42_001941 [Komagataella kurtzmanii]|nr:hypothetical protein LJB42_001941 [Komagataella kurtzmanii]
MTESLIVPGDRLDIKPENIILGPGFYVDPKTDEILPTNAGILEVSQKQNKTVYVIDSKSKTYIPKTNDFVIGIITGTFGELYKVGLSEFTQAAQMSVYAFPNASKKNRPHLKVGDVIYARVLSAERDIEVELECIDPTTGKEGGFGQLEDGYLFTVNLAYARYLLFNENAEILTELVKKCKFELAVGCNGRIWIKSETVKTTITCVKIIEESQNWYKQDIPKKLKEVWAAFN